MQQQPQQQQGLAATPQQQGHQQPQLQQQQALEPYFLELVPGIHRFKLTAASTGQTVWCLQANGMVSLQWRGGEWFLLYPASRLWVGCAALLNVRQPLDSAATMPVDPQTLTAPVPQEETQPHPSPEEWHHHRKRRSSSSTRSRRLRTTGRNAGFASRAWLAAKLKKWRR